MANIQNQYNNILKERKKILEELKQLKNEKFVKRYLLLEEKNRLLERKQYSLNKKLIYNRFCSCKHILVYTEFNHDEFLKNYKRSFACVKCNLNSNVLNNHRDFLSVENQAMYDYLMNNPFLERNITFTNPCNINLAKRVYEKVKEKYPNINNKMFTSYYYMALKYNLDNIKTKKNAKIKTT